MKQRIEALSAAAFLTLAGCAVMASKQASYGCQVADAATTLSALHRGAVEANPIARGLLHFGTPFFVVTKVVVLGSLLAELGEHAKATGDEPTVAIVAAANSLTCGAAAHNTQVIRGQR